MKLNYTLGAIFKIFHGLLFAIMSIFISSLSKLLPTAEIYFLRVFIGLLFSLLYLIIIREKIKFILPKKVFLLYLARATANFVAMVIWIEAIKTIGATAAVALTYFTPIWMIIMAKVFLKEKIEIKTLAAILFALMGMIVMLNPKFDNFSNSGIYLATLSTLLWALYDFICKKQTLTEHYMFQNFYSFLIASIMSFPFAVADWHVIPSDKLFEIMSLGIIGIANVTALFLSYRYAPIIFLVPFSYARLIFTAILAFCVQGIIPNNLVFLGSIIIIGTNFYMLKFGKK